MKKAKTMRFLSGFLALVMILLVLPVFPLTVTAETETSELPKMDYTPFLIESVDGKAVYNAQTADMLFDFYTDAKAYVDQNASKVFKGIVDGSFGFDHNGVFYGLNSVYIHKPTGFWNSTCGMLIGVLNYNVNGENKYVMMIMFEGTKGWSDIWTDLSGASQKVAEGHWYHNGFNEAAHSHYNTLKDQIFSVGTESITFTEYVERMAVGNNYQMLITGHSLGAATANIFASYYINDLADNAVQKNMAAYTFASPLTCSDATANNSNTQNVFNYINKWDFITKIGYGGHNSISAIWDGLGDREGVDLVYTAGSSAWKDRKITSLTTRVNHKMSSSIYRSILNQANANIINHVGSFVLYNNYDPTTHTHQRIIYNNGELIVSGSGVLAGDWSEHTLVDWAKVKDKCTSLTFTSDCTITEIGDYAFAGMSQLKNELRLPESLTKIDNYAFFHCGVTGEVSMGQNGDYKEITSVGAYAFYGSNLSKIDLSSLDLTKFDWGINAFKGCVRPEMLILPANAILTQKISEFGFSYYYENDNGVEKVTVNTGTANVSEPTGESYKVEAGSKIYCRTLEESKLESDKFSFVFLITVDDTTVVVGEEKYYTNYKDGLITVDPVTGFVEISDTCSPMHFTISAYHQNADGTPAYDIVHYYIDFEVTDNLSDFAGGQGTKDRPYLIKTSTQFKAIAKQPDKYYKLLNDIDFKGGVISPLGTLTGGLDGNGYAVYGFNISAVNAGLFNEISTDAYVKQLTIGKYREDGNYLMEDGKYSAWICGIFSGYQTKAGALACMNYGTIENCSVVHTQVIASASENWGVNSTINSIAGGLVVENYGTIKTSNIVYSSVSSSSTTVYDNNPAKCEAFSGGIVGINGGSGKIERSSSSSNTISAWAYSRDEGRAVGEGWAKKQGRGYSYCGGITAYSVSNKIDSCYSYANDCRGDRDSDDGVTANHAFVATGQTETINCLVQEHNCVNAVSSIKITSLLHKTHYYIGESLNLYGLLVEDNNGNPINGYKVEGYDPLCSGPQTVKVIYTNGYGTFDDTITIKNPDGTEENAIRVENVIPEAVVITPKDEQYEVGHKLTLSDLSATVYYNNGTVKTFDAEPLPTAGKIYFSNNIQNENSVVQTGTLVHSIEYHYVSYDFAGEPDGMPSSVSFALNVTCPHDTQIIENQSAPTPTEYGYTGDTVCTVCREIIAEGDILEPIGEPEIHQHTYTNWTSFDYEKHVRTCTSCGETEYQKHETQNVIESGTEYIICLHCDYKDKVETIDPPIVSKHEYGEWLGIDDKQHYRTCELCGEQEIAEHNFDVTSEGKVCSDCGYVIIPEEPPVPSAVITAENKTSPAGQTIQIKLDLSDNPGFAYLRLTIKYDTDALTLMNAENGSIIKDFDQGVNLMWSADKNATANGTMVTLIFEIDEEAEAGDYPIDIVIRECYDEDYNDVSMEDVDGVITVIDFIYGDVNGDFKVDGKDVLMLRKYLSNYDDDTGMSTVEVSFGSDANGDGITNGKDLLLLRKYMANYDDDLGSSTVVLGPAA